MLVTVYGFAYTFEQCFRNISWKWKHKWIWIRMLLHKRFYLKLWTIWVAFEFAHFWIAISWEFWFQGSFSKVERVSDANWPKLTRFLYSSHVIMGRGIIFIIHFVEITLIKKNKTEIWRRSLKLWQNQKGRIFVCHANSKKMSFLQLAAEKKTSFCWAWQMFGPSYFVRALKFYQLTTIFSDFLWLLFSSSFEILFSDSLQLHLHKLLIHIFTCSWYEKNKNHQFTNSRI